MTERQLAIFLDGDWNGTSSGTVLQRLCELTRSDVVQTYFDSGEATVLERIRGGTADPLLERAKRAYEWLCERYRDGTQIYVFGYSAGGMVALRLARLLAVGGLLRRYDGGAIESIVRWDAASADDMPMEAAFSFRAAASRGVRIRFLGLVDAAAPFFMRDVLGRFLEAGRSWMADGRLNPLVEHAFNALAIDESSRVYEPVIWNRRARHTRSVTQAWFRGTHLALGADARARNPLALISLVRLAAEASKRGLKLLPRWQSPLHREIRLPAGMNAGPGVSLAGDFAAFNEARLLRPWGAGIEAQLDDSVQMLNRTLGPPVPPADVPAEFSEPEPFLTSAEQTLFELNGLKPPEAWGRGKPASDTGSRKGSYGGGGYATLIRPEQPRRVLLAELAQRTQSVFKIVDTLQPGLPTWLRIRIDAPDPDSLQPFTWNWFHEPDFPRNSRDAELTVVVSASGVFSQPRIQHIVLPKKGSSTVAQFELGELPPESVFEARLTILHRNRALQSAIIMAPVGTEAKISMVLDANLVEDLSSLRQRTPADLCVLINERPEAGGRALIVAGELASEIAVSSDDPTIAEIINELSDVAGDKATNGLAASHPKKVLRMRNLAVLGRGIFDQIADAMPSGSPALAAPWPLSVQVVAAHKAKLYPLEIVYDYPAPGSLYHDAKPCPHWNPDAPLGQGTPTGCFDHCKLHAGGKHFCPNGFWGVKKTIERLGFQSGIPDASTQTNVPQRRLSLRGAAVLGVSQVVHKENQKASAELLAHIATNLRATPVSPVKDWEHLKELVAAHGPPFIALLPHVQKDGGGTEAGAAPGGIYLEIENALQRSSEIGPPHLVREGSTPLVLLLGCESALGHSKYDQSIIHFYKAGAAAVVAPLSKVAPSNVVRFVRDFSKALAAVMRNKSPSLAEAMRDARRSQFMDGNLPALGIMSFGDLDLRITFKR